MKPYILGAIFARGGSKGVPRKNLKELAGKPLIAYSIETGKAISAIDRLIVSTEDEEIAAVACKHGAEVPFMRPKELAQDDSALLSCWKHAIRTIEEQSNIHIDVFVDIPVTSPLRAAEDIENCIETLLNSDAEMVITISEAERNPYFNMVRLDENGYVHPAIQTPTYFERRQEAPLVYGVTTVAYALRASYVLNTDSLKTARKKAVLVPRERALDIDTEFDFSVAEFFMQKRGRK